MLRNKTEFDRTLQHRNSFTLLCRDVADKAVDVTFFNGFPTFLKTKRQCWSKVYSWYTIKNLEGMSNDEVCSILCRWRDQTN